MYRLSVSLFPSCSFSFSHFRKNYEAKKKRKDTEAPQYDPLQQKYSMKIFKMPPLQLVSTFLSMFIFVHGYTASVPIKKPILAVVDITEATSKEHRWLGFSETLINAFPTNERIQNLPKDKVSYDLGLGKNQPVVKTRHEPLKNADSIYHASRFISDFESARSYPSPLAMPTKPFIESTSSIVPSTAEQTVNKKNVTPIFPRRRSEDVVVIRSKASRPSHALAFSSKKAALLDPNTVWVEMLIHSEQRKHASLAHAL